MSTAFERGPDEPASPPRLSARRYQSFLVRVLTNASGIEIIHGDITHTATRHKLRFTDPRVIVPFILGQLTRNGESERSASPTPSQDNPP